MSKKIAVIGLGNTLRTDDGIGILVLESLTASYKREGVDYLNFGIASFDLLHRLQEYDVALLIDGINASFAPGELKIFELGNVEYDFKSSIYSSHEIDLRTIIELYKKLEIHARIYVSGIQVADVSYGEGLSEALENKKDSITKEISRFIDNTLKRDKDEKRNN